MNIEGMKIPIQKVGGGNQYVWVAVKAGYIELSTGFYDQGRCGSVTRLSREQALTLAHALRTVASTLP